MIADARTAARAGDWALVRESLEAVDGVERRIEGAVLLAESLLRTARAGRGRQFLEGILPKVEQSGDRVAFRKCLNMFGAACRELGDLTAAQLAWSRLIDVAHTDDDPLTLARATNNLGIVANMRGDHRSALGQYQLAIPTYQRLGHETGLAESYHNIAISYRDVGDLDSADESEQRAVEFAMSASNPHIAALARLGRAEISYRRGDAPLASSLAQRAAVEFAELGDPVREADATRLRGLAALSMGYHAEAGEHIEHAVKVARQYSNKLLQAEALRARAELRIDKGDVSDARADVSQAMVLYEELGDSDGMAATRDWLARRGI